MVSRCQLAKPDRIYHIKIRNSCRLPIRESVWVGPEQGHELFQAKNELFECKYQRAY